jgi:hypothetical protein
VIRPPGRRAAIHLGAGLLGGCTAPAPAGAQGGAPASRAAAPPAQAGLVLALPLPCADRAGDLTGLVLEGQGSPDRSVIVIGQAFRAGDLPQGAALRARTADGRTIPAQLDTSVRHPDGSVRFGVVSLAIPALPRGQRLGVVLSRGAAAAPDPPLDLAAALAGRQAVVTVTPAGGGPPWQAEILALALGGEARQASWQSGHLAVQRRVTTEVPPAAIGGVTSMRLVADIAARADGTLWVDLWLRNDVAMRPGGGPAAYSLRLAIDGREVLRTDALRHFLYQGWGRLIGAAPGGGAPPQPLLRPDTAYLAQTAAVARFDLSTGVAEELLARMAQAMRHPGWAVPLAPRGITTDMPTAGARADIGATTLWQAAWLTTGDPRAAAFCMDQAEAAGAVPWHMWDPRGGWMDARRWPGFWFDGRNGPPPRSLLVPPPAPAESGWVAESAHQPDLAFVPYLLTGRRALLDELQAQAAWNVLSVWPGPRGAPGAAADVNMINSREVRSAAWAMRQLNEAAWISPDDDPQAGYFRDVTQRNWAWARSRIPAWTAMQGEAFGWIPPHGYIAGTIAPWQQDYFTTTVAAAARHGNADARAVLAWMANFLVGRFEADAKGLARNDGAAFELTVAAPLEQPGEFYRSWAEIGAAMRDRGKSNGAGWARSEGEYGRLALQSLALLADVLDHAGARRAYQSLLASNPPRFTAPADHARVPTNNVTPPGLPRVPGRAPRCAPSRG